MDRALVLLGRPPETGDDRSGKVAPVAGSLSHGKDLFDRQVCAISEERIVILKKDFGTPAGTW